ncbi:hypothetical protein M408DRAFT_296066 [Serendipita vermifera MAFF 305830]|uniref:Uncharacterized protein n=1 Tax=Serendipita vermifera MAFF 305830 TaxID=933852 RepID=A0A0C2WVT1_SERVB|nr:hypothetical protein M408DRAFT_296066 [Serendipita vermifera MAFF 305830]
MDYSHAHTCAQGSSSVPPRRISQVSKLARFLQPRSLFKHHMIDSALPPVANSITSSSVDQSSSNERIIWDLSIYGSTFNALYPTLMDCGRKYLSRHLKSFLAKFGPNE